MVKKAILALVVVVAIVVVVVLVRGDTEEPPPPPEVRTTGPWVDSIVISSEPSTALGVSKLERGDTHIWLMPSITEPDLYDKIEADPDIEYEFSYGAFTDLIFNVAGPYFRDGTLNPFYDAEIREAFNWLIDRDLLIGEFLRGMGMPIYALGGRTFPEYERYPDLFEALEDHYAHDPDRARDVIHDRMVASGAELVADRWHYDGSEIEVAFVIVTDWFPPLYPAGGEYIADLMEGVNFSVERKLLPESAAIGYLTDHDPLDGTYNAFTGAWAFAAIPRDEGQRFYVSDTKFARPLPRWAVLDPPEDYLEVARRLHDQEYETMAEREELFEEAVWMRMRFSPQILLADVAGVTPWHSDLKVRTDLSIGFGWAMAQTIHFLDEDGEPIVGGEVKAEQSSVLVKPWNPVDGSPMAADLGIFRHMLQERGLMFDGRDGLQHPWRIERAELTVKEGLPVEKTHDWLTLDSAADIQAPSDAWVDWDAAAQRFITVGEKMDPGSPYYDEDFEPSANLRSVVHYPDGFYDVPMHDGSTLSLADIVMAMILKFDRAKPGSDIYDEGEVSRLEAFMANFRGVRIVSEDPLIIESYSKQWFIDAEYNVHTWFPAYGYYDQFAPWHVITIGKMAETDLALAWSAAKSSMLLTEWMDYTKGPSLPILRDYLDDAIADNYIPYGPTLGDYITGADASERYGNLKSWYGQVNHFWTTTAPFYLYRVHPVAGVIELRRFEDHPDPIQRWMFLLEDL